MRKTNFVTMVMIGKATKTTVTSASVPCIIFSIPFPMQRKMARDALWFEAMYGLMPSLLYLVMTADSLIWLRLIAPPRKVNQLSVGQHFHFAPEFQICYKSFSSFISHWTTKH